jgi:hypothetical protein
MINDRLKLKDGTIAWIAPVMKPGLKTTGPIDPQVGVISINKSTGKNIAILYNYSCHANCMLDGKREYLSADYPGHCSRDIEKKTGGIALFTPGASGNIHPARYGVEKEMGEKLAANVLQTQGKIRDYNKVSLDSRKKTVCIPFRDFKKFNPQQVLDICRQVDEKQRSQVVDAFMRRIDTFKKDRKKSITTAVQVIKIGDVAIAGIPGELFSEFGLEIKKRSPFKMTMVVDVAGDAIGYIPTKKAYIEGGYQTAVSSRLAPGSGEIMVKNVLELLKTKVKMP